MEKIDKDFVRILSNLVRLGLNDNEIDRLIIDLEKMLSYVSSLNRLETENIEPFSHVFDITNVWRKDIVERFPSPEKILENAPDRYRNYIKVPKII